MDSKIGEKKNVEHAATTRENRQAVYDALPRDQQLFMPHGFFTIEQWSRPAGGTKPEWIPVLHLDSYQSLAKAVKVLEKRGEPGLYRVLQTQRCLWGEMEGSKLRLYGSHVSTPKGLAELVEIFEREGGRRPAEKARQVRLKARVKRR